MKDKRVNVGLLFFAACLLSFNHPLYAEDIHVKDGETIAFMGDSITAQGWGSPWGYVRLVIAGLKAYGINITPIPAGAGGHKSNMMLSRLDRDVLQHKPDWMTLSCGVNDVWHGDRGVNLEDYKANMTAIVDQCQAAGVKVLILTPTLIGEQDNPHNNAINAKLDGYVEFLKELAREKNVLIADLNADMKQELKALQKTDGTRRNYLTKDGIHMNPLGDIMMAKGVLRTMGFDDAMIQTSEEAWEPINVAEMIRLDMSLEQYKKYSKLSGVQKRALRIKMKQLLLEAVQ